jgi:hypothetical protein
MEKDVLFHEYGLQLRCEPGDALVLNVLCGKVGEFGVEFQLDKKESERYKREGNSFLRVLAAKVRDSPEPYAARGRSC